MRKIFIYPRIKFDCSRLPSRNSILYRYYIGEIEFKLPHIAEEEFISNLELTMTSIGKCSNWKMEIYVEYDENINTICYPGIYRWDLSNLIDYINVNKCDKVNLRIYTSEMSCICNGYNIYDLFCMPLIQITVNDKFGVNYEKNQIYKEYSFIDKTFYTEWMQCTDLYSSIFYIKNTSDTTIKAAVNYGPIKDEYIADDFIYEIEPNNIISITQLKSANFIRLCLTNDSMSSNLITVKVWFLGTAM